MYVNEPVVRNAHEKVWYIKIIYRENNTINVFRQISNVGLFFFCMNMP
jgi:hypothetical protein